MPLTPHESPEQVRAAYQVRLLEIDRRGTLNHRRFVRRWTWSAALLGVTCVAQNHGGFGFVAIAHFVVSGGVGRSMALHRRGHLTGAVAFGLGIIAISIAVGHINPFGYLVFPIAGTVLAMA